MLNVKALSSLSKVNSFLNEYWKEEFGADNAPKAEAYRRINTHLYFVTYDENEEEYMVSRIDCNMELTPTPLFTAQNLDAAVRYMNYI